jgi:hypothetical protein
VIKSANNIGVIIDEAYIAIPIIIRYAAKVNADEL